MRVGTPGVSNKIIAMCRKARNFNHRDFNYPRTRGNGESNLLHADFILI